MQHNADRRLESSIDNSEYDESQLVEMRVQMNMPYQQRFTDFERHYGEIDINGKTYTYVKRKVEGDVLIVKCLVNTSKEQLKAIKSAWAKMNSGNETDQPGKQQQSFAKNFWSEYDGENAFQSLKDPVITSASSLSYYNFHLPKVEGNTPHQPPEC